MKKKILEFCIEVVNAVMSDNVKVIANERKYKREKEKCEQDMLRNINRQAKSMFEQESIIEWLYKQCGEIDDVHIFFDQDDINRAIEEFYLKNKELKYIQHSSIEKIIIECIQLFNEWGTNALSTENKLVIQFVNRKQLKNKNDIIEYIQRSKNEIIEEIKEINCSSERRTKSNYKVQKNVCSGYGVRKDKCKNYVKNRLELCKECKGIEYYERIRNLYKMQNYFIVENNGCFRAESKSGIIRTSALVVPLYSEKEKVILQDAANALNIINNAMEDNGCEWIHIVVCGDLKGKSKKIFDAYKDRLKIYSEEDIIDGIMDFTLYVKSAIAEYEQSSLFKHYIDLYDEGSEELMDYSVSDFLNQDIENAFLLLGDYGCGKTSYLLNLAYELSKKYLRGQGEYIPMFIPLRDYAKSINFDSLFLNLFINKCNMSNTSMEAFRTLLKYKKFVILFDGFDEVAKRVDYDVKYEMFNEICKYCTGNTKVIISCRPNYFTDRTEYKNLIENAHLQFEPNVMNNARFQETYIAELSSEQIKNYIESYREELEKNGVKPSDLQYLIENTHDLVDLSKRPFLLNIIVCTLPQLLEENKNKDINELNINAASLYKKYTGLWLDRENAKGKTLIRKEDKLHFCIHMAYKLFNDDVLSIHYSEFPKEIKEYFKNVDTIDEIDYFSHDIRSCSFMSSDGCGNFKFIHKSFMEYFVACYLSEMLEKHIENGLDIEDVLSARGISSEIALFVNDILENNTTLHKRVVESLHKEVNCENDDLRQNIVTLLSKMKYNMALIIENDHSYVNNDFSRSMIEDAMIENVDFSNTWFYGAMIKNVIFVNCNFSCAYFQKTTLENVVFSGQNLEGIDLSYAHIKGCDFSYSNLSQSQIAQATLIENDFERCDFSGVRSDGAKYYMNHNYNSALGIPYEMR